MKLNNRDTQYGTIDSFLLNNLTNNFYTDVTNASRTFLIDLKELKYDNDLLKLFELNEE